MCLHFVVNGICPTVMGKDGDKRADQNYLFSKGVSHLSKVPHEKWTKKSGNKIYRLISVTKTVLITFQHGAVNYV